MATAELNDAVGQYLQSHRDEIARMLLDLVAIPSVTGDEGAVQGAIASMMRDRDLDVDIWEARPEEIAPYVTHVGDQEVWDGRPNIVGCLAGSGGGRSLMVQGHVDVVDPGDPALWSRRQWGEIADGRVYGRGAADMKGGIVAYLAALDALRATGTRLQGDLLLAASAGEENGGLGALSTILRGHRADAVIVTEPTGLALVVAQGGSLVFRITVTGRAAHGANRNVGVSAVDAYIPIHQALLAWEAERNRKLSHPLFDHLENKFPISVGVVRAGTWASTVPETLVAEGRLGFLPGETIEEMQRQTEELIAQVANGDPWLREHPPLVEWVGGQFASAEVSPDAPIAQAIGAAHRQATGEHVQVKAITAGTDARLFAEIGGLPVVVYGAGELMTAHGPDEYAPVDQLLTAAHTIALTIAAWCGTHPES